MYNYLKEEIIKEIKVFYNNIKMLEDKAFFVEHFSFMWNNHPEKVNILVVVKNNRLNLNLFKFSVSISSKLKIVLLDYKVIISFTKPPFLLSKELVPYIYKKNLDFIAERIICKQYQRVMDKVDSYDFANKLGLSIVVRRYHNKKIMGRLFFKDEEFNGEYFRANTILINDLDTKTNNFSIMHECVHFILHRKAFLLANLLQNHGFKNDNIIDRKLDWKEWQANAIAARILMPKKSFMKEVNVRIKNKNSITEYL